MKKLSLKDMSTRGGTYHVYYVGYGDTVDAAAIEAYEDKGADALVVRSFWANENKVLTKGFLRRLIPLLNRKAKQLGFSRLGVERKPEHKVMYEKSGFVESEGDWSYIVSRYIR